MRTHPTTVAELTDFLVIARVITAEQAANINIKADAQRARLAHQQQKGKRRAAPGSISAAEIIASMEITPAGADAPLDEDTIVKYLARATHTRYVKIDPLKLDPELITQTVSLPFARRTSVIPIKKTGDTLTVAVSDPHDRNLFEELERLTHCALDIVLSPRSDIQRFITEVYGFNRSVAKAAVEMTATIDIGNLEQLVRLGHVDEIEANDRHVVSAVEYVLHYAFDQRASDIHIEPKRDASQIRMRIDGVLHDIYTIPKAVHPAIVTRLKTLSRLDLAERRRPQDGRFKTDKDGEAVEMRVSTLPVAFGEKVVIRVFDASVLMRDLADLGFDSSSYDQYTDFIHRPNGLILVTGPTGSGKTTTLYSTLKHLSSPEVNITTIEDPIEMVIEAFNQTAINPKIGLHFADALRHILRQDPDIIMVGEIRDPETAEQALQAALTGHLVLSTLHTNDSAGSVTRLLELGLNPYLVSSTLVGVMAQRLLRKVCDNCAEEVYLNDAQIGMLDIQHAPGAPKRLKVREGKGCVKCRGTGLFGRTAIYEILRVTEGIRDLINRRADVKDILREARSDGTNTLREAAIRQLAKGTTAFDEVIRITADDDF